MTSVIDFESPVQPGFSFEKVIQLSVEDISTFAKLSGDLNPLHHDVYTARASRFKDIIASGPHSSALFMSSVATHLAPGYLVLGMSFDVQFCAPVRPNSELLIRWVVKTVDPKPRLAGYIVTVKGGMADKEKDLLLGKGTCLVIKA